jgi:hypothetical protein
LEGEIAAKFLAAVLSQPRVKRLLSSEHFSVDGTLIQAWASIKSVKPKQPSNVAAVGTKVTAQGRSATCCTRSSASGRGNQLAHCARRRARHYCETHQSTTDPDARLYRKGPGMEARLCFIGHGLMENRG